MKKMLRSAAAVTLAGCMVSANALAAATFSDVPSTYWGATYISRAAQNGIVSGLPDGSYGINKTLSAAEFATMLCNLFYKDTVTAYNSQFANQVWWYTYMTVAYEKGLLTNTTVGDYRKDKVSWSTELVQGELSRYDMAQMLVNVASAQRWKAASSLDVLAAQTKIKDWGVIPQKYQSAVANAYARGFLSGMDNGNFEGGSAMTRTHGAVVLCKLLDAIEQEKKNTYTNTTKLVNGKEPTQSNVSSALSALKSEFPKNMVWSGTEVYTSGVLGSTYGCDAYAYTISDRVFGNLKATKVSDHEDMKVGDLLYLNSLKSHVVITDVDGDDFDYTYCTSAGAISWSGTGDIDDLTTKDILYTRYEDDTVDSDEALSNGKKATESNVEDLIEDFLDEEYDYGEEWDRSYKTDSFSSTSKTYGGDQALAYYLSDYIFEDLEVEEVEDFDDLRVGDILYVDEDSQYMLISSISGDKLYCIGLDDDAEVCEYKIDVDDLDHKKDSAYTRYPSDDDSDDDDDDDRDTLSNGKSATESNVEDLIELFREKKYDDGEEWDDTYKTSSFSSSSKTYSGSQAFAYYLSDYIFEDMEPEDVDDFDDLRIGDVIYWDEEELYLVVTDISGDTIDYISVDPDDDVVYSDDLDVDELGKNDEAYTRYPSSNVSNKNKKLSNGKEVTEGNVLDLLEEFQDEEYGENKKWDMEESYKSTYFRSRSVSGDEAFAYYLSDYIFDELKVSEIDFQDIRVGDVLHLDDEGVYAVVVDVDDRYDEITYVAPNSNGKVSWEHIIDMDELDEDEDSAYSRYPSSEEKLSNGKSITEANVGDLLETLSAKNAYKSGAIWDMSTQYTTEIFGKCKKDEAFSSVLSDEIFGDLEVYELKQVKDLRIGDVISLWDEGSCVIVTDVYVKNSKPYFRYACVEDDGEIFWDVSMQLSELEDGEDEVYTRYP